MPAKPDKDCVYGPDNGFLPATREVRAVIEGLHGQIPGPAATTSANGIYYGQYHAPIGEYIFPENVPGQPIPENNFNTMPFLTPGGYSSFTGVVAGQLDPWPSNVVPGATCVAPVANAGGPYTVSSGGTVTLAATSSGSAPTFSWSALAAASGSLSNANIPSPVYTAPVVSTTKVVTVSVTATNACGTNTSATTTITVNPSGSPTVSPVAAQSVSSGTVGAPFTVSGTDPNTPASVPLTFKVTQSPAALTNVVVTQLTSTSAKVSYTASVLAAGQISPTVVQLSITATNTLGLVSAPQAATVTIKPVPDVVGITDAEYRTAKQRLIITATSSVISPNVVLTLQPYLTATGVNFDPARLGNTLANGNNGIHTLTLVGAPQPAAGQVLVVKSNLGGVSPGHALDRVRA